MQQFLLAQLHIDSLAKKPHRRAVRTALESLPRELDKTYEEAMGRISSQYVDDVEVAYDVLSWIVYSNRPLHIEEVQHALAVAPELTDFDDEALIDEELLTSVCMGLVTVDRDSKIIRLIHHTTQEYLERKGLQYFPNAQKHITATCLNYLSYYVKWEDYLSCSLNQQQAEKWLSRYVLLDYTTQNWGLHAREVEHSLSHLLTDFLLNEFVVLGVGQVLYLNPGTVSFSGYLRRGYKGHSSSARALSGLHLAAFFDLQLMSKILISRVADVNKLDWNGEAPLHLAARYGRVFIMQLLLDNGARIDLKNRFEKTTLNIAISVGCGEAVQLLLDDDASICLENSWDHHTAFRKAVRLGYTDIVQIFYKSSTKQVRGALFETALHQAASKGYVGIMRLLLVNCPNVDLLSRIIKSEDFMIATSPLIKAAIRGHALVVQMLLVHGATTATKDETGGTALHHAVNKGDLAVTRQLLDNSPDVEALSRMVKRENSFRETNSSARAAELRYLSIVQMLLDHGAEIETKDGAGWTALHYTAVRGDLAMMNLLLRYGANVEAMTKYMETALCKAIEGNHEKIVLALLANGAHIDATDKYDPHIRLVRQRRDRAMLRLLLENGTKLSRLEIEREMSSLDDDS